MGKREKLGDEVVEELRRVAFSQADDGTGSALKYAGKLRALELLGKHAGLFAEKPQSPEPVKVVLEREVGEMGE